VPRNQRIVLVALAVIVAIAAVVVAISLGSDDDESASRPPTVTGGSAKGSQPRDSQPTGVTPATIVVKDGKPVGGVRELNYEKGDTIDLTVRSDTADEVHFHGYDLKRDVTAGGSVNFRFKATIDGRFEVELETAKEQLADVRVNP
jgi:hypothetical protein